jgi:hypothetical protein
MGTQSNLENAIAGRYDFNIKGIFSEAWKKTDGFKVTFWKALICMLIITFITSFAAFAIDGVIEGITSAETAASPRPLIQLIEMLFSIFLITPLFAGLIMLSIKRCVGVDLPFSSIFNYFKYWKQLWIYPVAMTVIALIKDLFLDYDSMQLLMFLVLAFITVTYLMFIPLVVEKNMAMWPALEASRKTVFHRWFKVLAFLFVIVLITIASALTLGIAFIWTAPWIYNAIAILYRDIFGIG